MDTKCYGDIDKIYMRQHIYADYVAATELDSSTLKAYLRS